MYRTLQPNKIKIEKVEIFIFHPVRAAIGTTPLFISPYHNE
jgi:hypothetical protein